LMSNSIMAVEVDKTNNLWIGHDKGLNRINLDDGSIRFYGVLEGFTPLETYQGAISVDPENNVWIGTGDGLVKYVAEQDILREEPPRTYITNMSIYGDSTEISSFADGIDSITGIPLNIRLPYNKNNLVFEYTGLHFSNPAKNRYQYMLAGYDDTWSEITDKTQTDQYKKLPHGSYTFKVRAANCDGIWTPEPVSMSFVITPPFWKTKVCYALEIILGITLIFLFVTVRERKLQHDKKVLAQKVKERTIEIEKQRDKIAEQNREITSSIMYAQRIQSAVLPDEEYTSNILPQHFILFKPRDIVSGDFYWMTEKGNYILVAAADCTGHGVPGAFMSMLGVSLLNEIVNITKKYQANEILESLRYNVKETLSQRGKKNEARDGMDIALCIMDFNNHTAQFAGAYNPLVLIRNSEPVIYKGDKMPIGIHVGHEKPFTNHSFEIAKDDMIYLYTDGYADQFGGPEEKKFKSCTFRQLLADIHNKPLEKQKEILDKTISDWKGELSQVDDIMVIGIRV
jgi:serine phosphatase RsbU (regulator of sigma subunit)